MRLGDLVNCGPAAGWALQVCHMALQGQRQGGGGSEAPREQWTRVPLCVGTGTRVPLPVFVCWVTVSRLPRAKDRQPCHWISLPLSARPAPPTQDPQDGTPSRSLRKGHRGALGREGTQVPIRLACALRRWGMSSDKGFLRGQCSYRAVSLTLQYDRGLLEARDCSSSSS